jgi:deoxyadenosine/deoxycytidine kinase
MYILEGNIGVGKSTFLDLIKKLCPALTIIQEPKENWATKHYGASLLENFYKDTPRWAYTLETLTMMYRVRDYINQSNKKDPLCIMERSVYSGHYCFAKNDYACGYLNETEWDIYNHWVNFFIHQQCPPPAGFIYLQARPEICLQRLKKRNRPGEESIPLTYVSQIHEWHEKFLIYREDLWKTIKNIPILVLDCNKDFVEDSQLMCQHLEKIKHFMSYQTGSHNHGVRLSEL